MFVSIRTALAVAAASLLTSTATPQLSACCPAPPRFKQVVNADQTVVIIWDAATHTEHFIRRASFKSEADDFGFIIPTPNQPSLDESGNDAFQFLAKLTEPETIAMPRPSTNMSCGCSKSEMAAVMTPKPVQVLEQKTVAGFNAVVLQADSTTALVDWLKANGYAFSPEVEAWATPYVKAGWTFTALKVAKSEKGAENKSVAASALRLTFKTDRPLFPYREPDSTAAAPALGASHRLLRIYFVADARYRGDLTQETAWTGTVAWANKLNEEDRKKALDLLKLPQDSGPKQWWMTEFEDNWPYRVAPADLYFSADADQTTVKRPANYVYVSAKGIGDVTPYALGLVMIVPQLLGWVRAKKRRSSR